MKKTKQQEVPKTKKLVILTDDKADLKKAEELSRKLGAEITDREEDTLCSELTLRFCGGEVSLTGDGLNLKGDFTRMLPRIKISNLQRELLVKAAKIKNSAENPIAVDATAGLGEDSFLLAAAGYKVFLFEYNPVIAALLEDALERGRNIPEISGITNRMTLFNCDSIKKLKELDFAPDLILLDPMFPERQKSALIKKKFQLLHYLEKPCGDEEDLVEAAIKASPKKIVIKRPPKGPFLAGIKPNYSLTGKAVRYDCLVFSQNGQGD